MRPIHDVQRRRLLALSAMFCSLPIVLAPLAAQSSFELPTERSAFDARITVPVPPRPAGTKPVVAARDPFVPDAGAQAQIARVPVPAAEPISGMRVEQGQPLGFALPANAGALGSPPAGEVSGLLAVRAIVKGASARALVDEGGAVRVIAVGDALGGSIVTAIDASRIRLKNARVLVLEQEGL